MFIILTTITALKIRVNVNQIESYYSTRDGTHLYTVNNGTPFKIKESVEDVDTLLRETYHTVKEIK